MAIDWGAWEYSGGNGMRVGVDVSIETITHGDAGCTFTVEYYTENQYSMGDTQTMNFTGSIGGSSSFSNNAGGAATKRFTKSYTYDYPNSSYGSSPGSKTFGCNISGAYNGVTPSTSHTSTIPARPYASPAAPTSCDASRVNDENNKIAWVNHETAGEPYDHIFVERYIYDVASPAWSRVSSSVSGSATSYTDAGAIPNRRYSYRVAADNGVGTSGWNQIPESIFTAPATPTGATRTEISGTLQRITFNNNVYYEEHYHIIERSTNGGAFVAVKSDLGSGVATWDDTTVTAGNQYKYRIRARTTAGVQGTLYSSYSGETTTSTGTSYPPLTPTSLNPDGGATVIETAAQQLTWKHNPGADNAAQTGFEIQHRVVGAGSWTSVAKVTSSVASWTMPANTYTKDKNVEWQVRTYGVSATPSPWSTSALFSTQLSVPLKYPLFLDVASGRVEASSAAGTAVTDTGWVNLTLLNGWVAYGGSYATPSYRKVNGIVYLRGLCSGPSATSGIIATLPTGFRPEDTRIFGTTNRISSLSSAGPTSHNHPSVAQRIDVSATGSVFVSSDSQYGVASFWASLDGIQFPVPETINGTVVGVSGGTGTGLTDKDYGDITVSGTGQTMTIDPGAVTTAKMDPAAVSALMPDVYDEGVSVVADTSIMDFVGPGVTVDSPSGGRARVTIPSQQGPSVSLPPQRQVFTANGTWTKPPGCTYVEVEVQGGGGGGGGAAAAAAAQAAQGPGGAGGGYVKHTYLASELNATEAVVVGAGGAGGTAGANAGTVGGNSTFKGLTGSGGGAGTGGVSAVSTTNSGGTGGAATGGTINIQGGDGGASRIINGSTTAYPSQSAFGGGSALAGVTRMVAGTSGAAGTAGHSYGGGGSGATSVNAGSAFAGGAGADGVVILEVHFDGGGAGQPTAPMKAVPQVFTASGTWTKPANCAYVEVEMVGGGGGSAGSVTTTAGQGSAGGAGGGGGYVRKTFLAADLNATEAVVVGTGGTAGAAGANNGGNGVASTFKGMSANGGNGGQPSTAIAASGFAVGGLGGTATGGDVNIPGGDGPNQRILVSGASVYTMGVVGGPSVLSGGGPRTDTGTQGQGIAGYVYGSGAVGPYNRDAQTQQAGAVGGAGVVIITSYVNEPVAAQTPVYGFWQSTNSQSFTSATWTIRTGWAAVGAVSGITANADGTFTVSVPGIYLISANSMFTGNTTGRRLGMISAPHVLASGIAQTENNSSIVAGNQISLPVTAMVKLAAGDIISYQCFQSSGAALTMVPAAPANFITIKRLADVDVAAPTLPTARCEVTNNAAQSIPDGTATVAVMNTTAAGSTAGMADLANNRIVVPVAGLYAIDGQVWWAGAATTNKYIWYRVNAARKRQHGQTGIGATVSQLVSGHEWLNAGDYVDLSVQLGGQALSTGVIDGYSAKLAVNLIRV